MNRTVKITTLSLMAFAMAGVVALVAPQLVAAQKPSTDASQNGSSVAINAPQSDVVDAYNWRTTVSPGKNKGGF